MSNVVIRVASEYDNKGFKQADTGIQALTKSVAKFAGGLALAHKAQKAMFDYMADEKATKILAQNLKNVGLAYATQSAEEFIKAMQQQTGVLDDELRPAYAQLARVTGSVVETQKLLYTAWNTAAGSGADFSQVVDALSQAYVGNTKGLKALNIGLTNAELQSKSFAEITDVLNSKFAGSGTASLDSYAGQMALLQVAAADASETIGKSLLDALSNASGPNGFQGFIGKIQGAANLISDLVTGTSRLISIIGVVASPSKGIGDILDKYNSLRKKWAAEDLAEMKVRNGIANNTSSYFEKQAKDSIIAKQAAAAAALAEKRRLELLKKQTAEKKSQAALDKANALVAKAKEQFDLEGIQLQAALLNGKLSEEEKKRLELKKATWELEQAIAQGDEERIAKATELLQKLLGQFTMTAQMKKVLDDIKAIFDAIGLDRNLIDVKNLAEALNLLKQFQSVNFALTGEGKPMGGSLSGYTPSQILGYNAANAAVNPDMPVFGAGLSGYYGMSPTPSQASQDIYVTAIVEGNVMSQNDLAEAIRQQIQDAQQSGKDVNWARQALPATFL